jgi:putative nucleotidyltransferase with HDIG domain
MATAFAEPRAEIAPAAPTRRRSEGHKSAGRRLLEAFEAFEHFPAFVSAREEVLEAGFGYHIGADLTAAVESDLSLTVAVLRRANSDGVRAKKVATVPDALVRIGDAGLREVVESTPSFDLFERSGVWGTAPQSHRVHALATQRAAARLVSELVFENADELYVAALLHDIGKLVLTYADERYSSIDVPTDLSPERRVELERREMGVDHAVVGGVLARRWGLPHTLSHAIERHHNEAETGLPAMVRLADMIARFEAGNPVSARGMRSAASNVGVSVPRLRSLLAPAPTRERRSSTPSPLTRSEQKVMIELGKGFVYKEIAHELGLSTSTVRTHLYNVYRKLGVADRAQAVLLARENNWI